MSDDIETTDASVPESYFERLNDERNQLADRLDRLRTFLETDTFATLPAMEKEQLQVQSQFMDGYLKTLNERMTLSEVSAAMEV